MVTSDEGYITNIAIRKNQTGEANTSVRNKVLSDRQLKAEVPVKKSPSRVRKQVASKTRATTKSKSKPKTKKGRTENFLAEQNLISQPSMSQLQGSLERDNQYSEMS